jgi:hypothetical protein
MEKDENPPIVLKINRIANRAIKKITAERRFFVGVSEGTP